MYSYNYNVPYNTNNMQYNEERFGAVPFLLGGVAGYALGNTGFGNNNSNNNTSGIIYPIYPSYYYPYFPSYNNAYPYTSSNTTSNNYYYY